MSATPAQLFASVIVIQDHKVLMVQEGKDNYGQLHTWNLPAGHVELGESIAEAAVREAREESGYETELTGVVAINKIDFDNEMGLVVFFAGRLVDMPMTTRENGITDVQFMPIDEMKNYRLRFPELIKVVEMAKSGKVYELDMLMHESRMSKPTDNQGPKE